MKILILKLANKILMKMNSSAEVDGVQLVRMSNEFHKWVYKDGYKIFEEKQKK